MDLKQVKYTAITLVDFLKAAIARGEIIADEETKTKRLEICKGCPKLSGQNQCAECGCWMDFKIPLSASKCPLEKW